MTKVVHAPSYPEPQCCMCAAKRSTVHGMVAGPGIFICGRCVSAGLGKGDDNGRCESKPHPAPSLKCNFCGRKLDDSHYIVTGEQANICDDCLRLCERILSEQNNAT